MAFDSAYPVREIVPNTQVLQETKDKEPITATTWFHYTDSRLFSYHLSSPRVVSAPLKVS